MVKKILLAVFSVIVLAISGGVAYLNFGFPKVSPAQKIVISATPELVARGEYLAKHVSVCMDCHSKRDFTKYSGPVVAGTEGMGGDLFDEKYGLPGKMYARNITPAGIGAWTDGELLRAITCGVSRDGSPLFPIMLYHNFAKMSQNDLRAIVAYIRTLPAVPNEVPPTELSFPMNLIARTIPQDAPTTAENSPSLSDTVAYGRYLVTMAICGDCHTPEHKGQFDTTRALSGGNEFQIPGGIARPGNITPHGENGIGSWSKETFLSRFRAARAPEFPTPITTSGDKNTIMPWTAYAGMTDDDLGAIYAYLRSIPAIDNKVEKWTPMGYTAH